MCYCPSMLKANVVINPSTRDDQILAVLSRIESTLKDLELRMMKLETQMILRK
jgi:hypothetical protein